MSLEKNDLIELEALHGLDAEHVWGGEEWEWINWKKAHRDMDFKSYNLKQMEEMVGIKTHEAFMAENHKEPVSNDELAEFFISKGGARYFKRRFFQYRSDVPETDIARYYENKEWDSKETNTHV